jgi:hypothetical protein
MVLDSVRHACAKGAEARDTTTPNIRWSSVLVTSRCGRQIKIAASNPGVRTMPFLAAPGAGARPRNLIPKVCVAPPDRGHGDFAFGYRSAGPCFPGRSRRVTTFSSNAPL